MIIKKKIYEVKADASKSKKNQWNKIKEFIARNQVKLKINRGFGIYQIHRIYGDIIFTDQLFDIVSNPISPFELYAKSKIIRQIHNRNRGVLFEFEEYDEKFVASIEFIKSRLMTLGNKDAKEFCNVLDHFQEFFLQKEAQKYPITSESYPKIQSGLALVDEIFEKHKEDVVIIKGSNFISQKDFRTKFLCFNSKSLELISEETNYFTEEFMFNCMKIFPVKRYTEIIDLMNLMIGNEIQTKSKKIMNTVLGEIDTNALIKIVFLPIEKQCFFCVVIPKEDFDPDFMERLKAVKLLNNCHKKKKECEQNKSEFYCKLLKSYYH